MGGGTGCPGDEGVSYAAGAALLLALAVTAHNVEEMIWLPGFKPGLVAVSARAFRFAASAIAVVFWVVAIAVPYVPRAEAIMAGFAAAMMFNAVVPHLALTAWLRRYHPGTATAWLAVVPAGLLMLASTGGAARLSDPDFLVSAVAGFAGLAISLPVLLLIGRLLVDGKQS